MNNKLNLIVLVGVPGQGKTTFADKNQLAITAKYGVDSIISSDAVISDIALALNKTYTDVFKDTINLANRYVEVMLGLLSLRKSSIIIDRTNLTKDSRRNMLNKLMNASEYNKIAIVFNKVDAIELRRRLDERGHIEGKLISPTLLKEMQERFEYPEVSEGFDQVYTADEFLATLPVIQEPQYGETKFG